jgi:plastocyanin
VVGGLRSVCTGGAFVVVAGALLAGCAGSDDPQVTVLVDYEHDEFATQFIRFLPEEVRVHPGDTVVFKQAWTGEPHTVTFGTLVADVLEVTRPLYAEWRDTPFEEIPPEVLEEFFAAEGQLPNFYPSGPQDPDEADDADGADGAEEATATDGAADETGDAEPSNIVQALAQPCLLHDEEFPTDPDTPCEVRDLPPFDGTPAYYNSGIIPYEGPGGNVFTFTLADDVPPGTYPFYCAVHGSMQSGVLEVVPPDEPLPPPQEVAATTRSAVNDLVRPYEGVFSAAGREEYRFAGTRHPWNYAGLLPDEVEPDGIINEFIPADIDTKVGEPVTWRLFGPHSISFDVPEYLPIVEFRDDGSVHSNEAIWDAAGGAPPVPEQGEYDENEPLVVDGGTYDGEGFWSSGVLWSAAYVEYTVRFSAPGTYPYACLIHPPMVGTVRVSP